MDSSPEYKALEGALGAASIFPVTIKRHAARWIYGAGSVTVKVPPRTKLMTFPRIQPAKLLRCVTLSALCASLVSCIVVPDEAPRRHYHGYKTYPSYAPAPAYRYYPAPPPPPPVYRPGYYRPAYAPGYGPSYSVAPIAVLPYGASRVVIRGESCWFHNGHYYRRHPLGFVLFVP